MRRLTGCLTKRMTERQDYPGEMLTIGDQWLEAIRQVASTISLRDYTITFTTRTGEEIVRTLGTSKFHQRNNGRITLVLNNRIPKGKETHA